MLGNGGGQLALKVHGCHTMTPELCASHPAATPRGAFGEVYYLWGCDREDLERGGDGGYGLHHPSGLVSNTKFVKS